MESSIFRLNGHNLAINKAFTVLQACKVGGVEIPRFCFHEYLSIAGNCRMCLVEVQKSIKPVASCAMPLMDNMVVFTNSSFVRKARESVLEFLLVNHPLDCPICDQGGECDLQDQTITFGTDRGRFYEYKRAVFDKDFGPLIKTIMTRCIHCTRCVRFAREVAGVFDLGVVGRGMNMEIGTYVDVTVQSELSGNVIDLCPVGALTAKPSAFRSRKWELFNVESVDLFDCFGSNIVLCMRGLDVIRVLPRVGRFFSWDWITDRARFFYDGLSKQRLASAFGSVCGKFCKFLWEDVLSRLWFIFGVLEDFNGIVGGHASLEMSGVFKELLRQRNGQCFVSYNTNQNSDMRSSFFFDFCLRDVDKFSNVLSIQSNLRYELPLLHSRFRYNVSYGRLFYQSIGGFYDKVGATLGHCLEFFEGRLSLGSGCNNGFVKCFMSPFVAMMFDDISFSHFSANVLRYFGSGLNVVETEVGRLSLKELGLSSDLIQYCKSGHFCSRECGSLLYTVGGDCGVKNEFSSSICSIYQGGFLNDFFMRQFSFLLPGVSFVERRGFYFNLFGFLQLGNFVLSSPTGSFVDEIVLLGLLKNFVYSFKKVFARFFYGRLFFFRWNYWFNLFFSVMVVFVSMSVRLNILLARVLGGFNVLRIDRNKNLLVGLSLSHVIFVVVVCGACVLSSVLPNFFDCSEVLINSRICQGVLWLPRLFIFNLL